jgi:diguanylate cyclase
MISIKKHLQNWQGQLSNPELEVYRALLVAVGESAHRAFPDLESELKAKLNTLGESLAAQPPKDALYVVQQTAESELSGWADLAIERQARAGEELKQVIEIMARALMSVTERDDRYAKEVSDLTERLRSIASMNDLSVLRTCILESANSLHACVEKIAAETEASRESLCRLAAQVEDYRARLDKSETLSVLDPLTGLANRRGFEDVMDAKVKSGSRFCLVLLDLNHFKKINDHLGHVAGDDALKQFAARLQTQFPSADVVARWGGDEFAVIMSMGRRDVEARMQRIRRAVLGQYRLRSGARIFEIAIDASIGIAEWDGLETAHDLLIRVDSCMYEGKQRVRHAT